MMLGGTEWITLLLLTLLVLTALTLLRMPDLWGAVMLMGIYSFLSACWMLMLDAPDVAFTEASVGAGISTILGLATLALTTTRIKPRRRRVLLPRIIALVTGAILVYGTLDMPHFEDPEAPIHRYPDPSYVERTPEEIGVPNVVTAVLAGFRGYDTFGETMVIFTAGLGVLLLLRGRRRKGNAP
jgi:multicomponent Na+:H+ antiporter subunit B